MWSKLLWKAAMWTGHIETHTYKICACHSQSLTAETQPPWTEISSFVFHMRMKGLKLHKGEKKMTELTSLQPKSQKKKKNQWKESAFSRHNWIWLDGDNQMQ